MLKIWGCHQILSDQTFGIYNVLKVFKAIDSKKSRKCEYITN